MKPAYFGQCSYYPNIDKSNYPEETELDTNPSLTLARNLTLSTGERSFGHFTSSRYDTTIVNFAYMKSPKNLGRDPESRSEIALRQNHNCIKLTPKTQKYDGNRSCRQEVSDHVVNCLQDQANFHKSRHGKLS